jgi:glucokinase
VVGVDLGGTKVLGRILDPADPTRVLATRRLPTPVGDGGAVVDAVVAVVEGLLDDVGADRSGGWPVAVGLGAPGLVDVAGVLRFAPNLPGVVDLDLHRRLTERLGVPVAVDNDATVAALGEARLGAGVGVDDVIVLTLGTGIGGGIVVGGRIWRGTHGFAGEPGHMLVDPHGPPCPCGRRGCWERYASGTGLGRIARDAALAGRAGAVVAAAGGDPDAVRGEHVGVAAVAGDAEALAILDEFAWWVAVGVANLVNVLDPAMVVLGGGLVSLGELLLGPVRRAYDGLVLAAPHRPPVRIEAAVLGQEAGAVGAWLLGADLLAGADGPGRTVA